MKQTKPSNLINTIDSETFWQAILAKDDSYDVNLSMPSVPPGSTVNLPALQSGPAGSR